MSACPENWVPRRIEDEYGVDLEVELFDGDKATGLTFKVQLKSKDVKAGRTPSKSVKVASLNYWLNHDVPVLVVLYDKRTGTLYGSWAHAHDTGLIPDGAKTTTFTFGPANMLNPEMMARLDDDVRVIRNLKESFSPRPTPVTCVFADNIATKVRSPLVGALKTAFDRSRGELTYVPNADYAITVRVAPDRAVVELPTRKATVTLHWNAADLSEEAEARKAASEAVVCGVALLFQSLGLRARAVDLLNSFLPTRLVYEDPLVSGRVAELLLDGKRPDLAVRVITHSPVDANPYFLLMYLTAAQVHYSELSSEDRVSLNSYYSDRAQLLEAADDRGEAAIAHYSLSQLARAELDFLRAKQELQAVAQLDPRYLDRAYFHRELAGSLWETASYGKAAESYRRALDLGAPHEEVGHLYVDALLWAGRYEAARLARQELGISHRLALLDDAAAVYITEYLGVKSQERSQSSAADLDDFDAEQAVQYLREVDALNPAAWRIALELTPSPGRSLLVVALALVSDGWAWAAAVSLGALEGLDESILDAMIDTGLHFDRVGFLGTVEEMSRLQGVEGPELTSLLDAITEKDAATPSRQPEPFLLRVHGGEGSMKVLQLGR